MSTTGFQFDPQQRVGAEAAPHSIMRYRWLAARRHRHALAVHRVATNRRVHRSTRHRHAVDHRQILPRDGSRLHLRDQRGVRSRAARHHQQATGVLIQAMHQTGARQCRQFRRAMQQGIDQRAIAMAGGRMRHQPGRFVNHQQIVIFVQYDQRNRLRQSRGFDLELQIAAHGFPAGDRVARPTNDAVHPQLARLEPLLQTTARIGRQQLRQCLIQPHSGTGGGNPAIDSFGRRHDGFWRFEGYTGFDHAFYSRQPPPHAIIHAPHIKTASCRSTRGRAVGQLLAAAGTDRRNPGLVGPTAL